MYIGYYIDNMPNMDDIRSFAKQLSELTGYSIAGESAPSRVVLLKN
ncbi:MAG: hypothetical protein ACE5J7_04835 [Candidatus Aenigmatarchaeota archaeon]